MTSPRSCRSHLSRRRRRNAKYPPTCSLRCQSKLKRATALRNDFAAVHTGVAETLKFTFPAECCEVEALFTGETWHDVQTLELKTAGPDTRLFRYELK